MVVITTAAVLGALGALASVAAIGGAAATMAGAAATIAGWKRKIGDSKKREIGIHDRLEMRKTAEKRGITVDELENERIEKFLKEVEDRKKRKKKKSKKRFKRFKDKLKKLPGGKALKILPGFSLIGDDLDNNEVALFNIGDLLSFPIFNSLDGNSYWIEGDEDKNILNITKISDRKIFGSKIVLSEFILYLDHTGKRLYFFDENNIDFGNDESNEDKKSKIHYMDIPEACHSIKHIGNYLILLSESGLLYSIKIDNKDENSITESNTGDSNIRLLELITYDISAPKFLKTNFIVKDIKAFDGRLLCLDTMGNTWLTDVPLYKSIKKISFNHVKLPLENPNGVPLRVSLLSSSGTSYDNPKHMLVIDENGSIYSMGDNSKGQLGIGASPKYATSWKKVNVPKNVKAILCYIYENGSVFLGSDNNLYHFGSLISGPKYNLMEYRSSKDLTIPSTISIFENTENLMIANNLIIAKKRGEKFKYIKSGTTSNSTDADIRNQQSYNPPYKIDIIYEDDDLDGISFALPKFNKTL